jgi:hypothetical protein
MLFGRIMDAVYPEEVLVIKPKMNDPQERTRESDRGEINLVDEVAREC